MARITIQIVKDWVGTYDHLLDRHEIHRGDDFTDSDVVIANTSPITDEALAFAHELKGIVRLGAGYDNVPLALCEEMGIVCAYTPNAPSRSVAELALGLILSAERGIGQAEWHRTLGRELQGLVLGVVGAGRIGKRLIALAQPIMGQIGACDPVNDTTFDEIHGVGRMSMADILHYCDVVTLHVPLNGNQHLIGAKELARMKPNATLVNTSRGGIVDEDALLSHMKCTPDFKYACDTFETEAYAGPLLDMAGFTMTSHMGSMTGDSRDRMERHAIEAALAIINDQPPQWVIEG